jgi:uncharacterized cupin superfamily protein
MKVTRIYTGSDGKSHFGENEYPDLPDGTTQHLKSNEIFFLYHQGAGERDWHNAIKPQFLVMLEGELEFELGDGSKRLFKPGDIVLLEDTTGQGHRARRRDRKVMVVDLA